MEKPHSDFCRHIIQSVTKALHPCTYSYGMAYPLLREVKRPWHNEIGEGFTEDGTQELVTWEQAMRAIEEAS